MFEEPRIILGIEGGGTKTTWALLEDNKILAEGKVGPCNYQIARATGLKKIARDIRKELPVQPHAIGAALAGCALPVELDEATDVIRSVWKKAGEIHVGEDTRSGYAAALRQEDGILVIAGTGSNALGKKGDRYLKANGWGHILGDKGSGYDVALRGLQSTFAHYDKTGKVSAVGQRILRQAGFNTLEELIPTIYSSTDKTHVAAFAPCVLKAAEAKDTTARRIIVDATDALTDGIECVAKRLRLKEPRIGIVGSLLEKSKIYRDNFEKHLRRKVGKFSIHPVEVSGAVGAARMIAPNLTPTKKKR